MSASPRRARAAATVYMVYRKCTNWEAGGVLFEGEPLLWFDSQSAAHAVYSESATQARNCLANEFETIRRDTSMEFTSGYSWAAILFGFTRMLEEGLAAARTRIEEELRDEANSGIGLRLRAALIAADGGHLEPVYGSRDEALARPLDLEEELEELADYLS